MNKYSLTFHNPQCESQYQIHQLLIHRARTFKVVSIGYIIAFAIRLLQALLSEDKNYLYYKCGLFFFFLVQYIVVKQKPQLIRLAFVLINLVTLAVNQENDNFTTLEIQYVKGTNAMAGNILMILASEFPESIFVCFTLTIYRLITAFAFGAPINWSVIFSAVCLNLGCAWHFYNHNKARRAQYLLSLIDNSWDKILQELITQPYIILKFDYENIQFQVQKAHKCTFLKYRNENLIDYEVTEFLKKATVRDKKLEDYIYEQIIEFQKYPQEKFNTVIFPKLEKKMMEAEISIFQATTPIIILKFTKKSIHRPSACNFFKKRFTVYNQFMIKLLKGLESNYHVNNIKSIRRKLIQTHLLNSIYNANQSFKMLNLELIITNLRNLYPQKIIKFKNQQKFTQIQSISNIFLLLLMKILETSLQTETHIEIHAIDQTNEICFSGFFDMIKVNNLFKKLEHQINQIVEQKKIKQEKISLRLHKEPFISYDL